MPPLKLVKPARYDGVLSNVTKDDILLYDGFLKCFDPAWLQYTILFPTQAFKLCPGGLDGNPRGKADGEG